MSSLHKTFIGYLLKRGAVGTMSGIISLILSNEEASQSETPPSTGHWGPHNLRISFGMPLRHRGSADHVGFPQTFETLDNKPQPSHVKSTKIYSSGQPEDTLVLSIAADQ
jgi:hypothetical protein